MTEACDVTLETCELAEGLHGVLACDIERSERAGRVIATSRRAGEELTFGLVPAELAGYLAERGLHQVSDIGAAEYRPLYYGSAASRIRGHEFYRLAHAMV